MKMFLVKIWEEQLDGMWKELRRSFEYEEPSITRNEKDVLPIGYAKSWMCVDTNEKETYEAN